MRILAANIPVQTIKSPPSPNAQQGAESLANHQARVADSYSRNARPQGIDAEFVEIYSPSTKISGKERSDLDLTIEPETPPEFTAASSESGTTPKLNKYQQHSTTAAPRPGSFIDIFA